MKLYDAVIKVPIALFAMCCTQWGAAQNCSYSLKLADLGRNGWGTAGLRVQITGQTDSTYRMTAAGDSLRFALSVRQGDSVRLTYVRSNDNSDGQNRFVLFDANGDTITTGAGTVGGTVFSFAEIASCSPCRRVKNVEVRRVSATYVQLFWNINAMDASSFAVEYGPVGFRPGTGTVRTATDTLYYLTGLREKLDYEVYVSPMCGGNKAAYGQPVRFSTYYATDVAVVDLANPWSKCNMGIDTVKIVLKNFGGLPQSLINYRYSVNGVPGIVMPPSDGVYTGVISKDSTVVVKFRTPYNFSTPDDYDFKAWVEVRGDSLSPNDTFRTIVTSVPTITTLPYVSGFEPKRGGWTIGRESVNASWDHGKPADINGNIISAASGERVWTTHLTGNYKNNEWSYLYSPCLDFSLYPVDPEILFSLNYNTEATYDGMRLEGSNDGGATWQVIGTRGSGVNWYNDTVYALRSAGWTRNSNGWLVAKNALTGFARKANCRLRFVFASDLNINAYDGVAIDNMMIRMPVTVDLAAANANNRNKTICGSLNDSLTIQITNLSNLRQYRYAVSYQVNNSAVVTELIDSLDILPGRSVNYTFRTPVNSTVDGDYTIKTWVKAVNDGAIYNDTTVLIFNRPAAVGLPVAYHFNNYQLPTHWLLSRDAAGIQSTGHGNRGNNGYLYANIYGGSGRTFSATTSKLGFIRPLDSMSYDYRVVNGNMPYAGYNMSARDTIFVEVAACGGAWALLDTIHAGNHAADSSYKTRKISLSRFAGSKVQVRFRVVSAISDFTGYFIDFDNINFFGCQALNIVGVVTDARIFTSNDGQIQASATNGLPPYAYTWSFNGNPTVLTGSDIRNLAPGTYTVRATDARGCFDEKTFVVSFGNKVFEASSSIARVQLAPNPTTGMAVLSVEYNKAVDATVSVYQMTGQLIYQTRSQQQTSAQYELDLANFAAGVYLVRVTAENKTHVIRLVKQ